MGKDLVVLFEHPEWQKPLWAALERRRISYAALDLKHAAFDPDAVREAARYFNQASPSGYVRGDTRAVPLALWLMCSLELGGVRVSNTSRAFPLELSKSAQDALLRRLEIPHPRSLAFNDPETVLPQWTGGWPTEAFRASAMAETGPHQSDPDHAGRLFERDICLGLVGEHEGLGREAVTERIHG